MTKPKIVIVGAGFGGMFCAKSLQGADADILLIDRQNHHLFQPLLYQVAAGFLGINDVAFPVRRLFLNRSNIRVAMEDVVSIDVDGKTVNTAKNKHPFDYLVIGTGASYSYFGRDEWRERTTTLKTLEDAIEMRQSILASFEKAELSPDESERNRLLTYVVIGGGPTGVEMASAIADVVNYALEKEFRIIKRKNVSIYLLEAGPRVLSSFDEKLSAYALRSLKKKGVLVYCGSAVKEINDGKVSTAERTIESDIVIWAAGVQSTQVSGWLGVPTNKNGTVSVEGDLSVPGKPNIFVLGDAARCMQNGQPLAALASVAKQQGKYLGKTLKAKIAGKAYKNFYYRDYGTMATIGRNAAVMQVDKLKISGLPAWVIWGIVHIMFLTGFRNQVSVFITWVWTYLTYGMGSRIILRQEQDI